MGGKRKAHRRESVLNWGLGEAVNNKKADSFCIFVCSMKFYSLEKMLSSNSHQIMLVSVEQLVCYGSYSAFFFLP